jgi:hypothetical protein
MAATTATAVEGSVDVVAAAAASRTRGAIWRATLHALR